MGVVCRKVCATVVYTKEVFGYFFDDVGQCAESAKIQNSLCTM